MACANTVRRLRRSTTNNKHANGKNVTPLNAQVRSKLFKEGGLLSSVASGTNVGWHCRCHSWTRLYLESGTFSSWMDLVSFSELPLGSYAAMNAELLRCESVPAVYISLENLPTQGCRKLINFFNSKQIFEARLFIDRLLANEKQHVPSTHFLEKRCFFLSLVIVIVLLMHGRQKQICTVKMVLLS